MNEWLLSFAGRTARGETTVDVVAPATGHVVAHLHLASLSQIQEAITSAHAAFAQTRSLAPYQRKNILENVVTGLRRDHEKLSRLIQEEAGKPITLARAEVDRAILTFQTAAEETVRQIGEAQDYAFTAAGAGKFAIQKRFPIGLITAITPFNFPLNLVAHKLAPALATGNPVLLRPASQTPGPAAHLVQLIHEAGWPKAALAFIPCHTQNTSPLLQDERIAMVSFTGSVKIGHHIRSQLTRARLTLELGGNAFAISAPDVNSSTFIPRLAAAAFNYSGQSCISVQNIVVPATQFDHFCQGFVKYVERHIQQGDLNDPQTHLGPLINREAAEKMDQWITQAQQQGARLLTGGTRDGLWMKPTVLSHVPPACPITCDEAFGPIVVLDQYHHIDDVFTRINQSRFGLQTGLFTNDLALARRAFDTLEVGALLINEVPTWRIDPMPYGGVKDSGVGREGIRCAMYEMTELKLLILG